MSEATMTKDEWVELFRAAGVDETWMRRWHREFEKRYPAQHQAFLGWLQLPEEEIQRIREHSRS
jgi:hypothetical protein